MIAEICLPATSCWFDGHFPGSPVLPGVAQLSMVFELIGYHAQRPIRVVSVSRVRFKRMILPEDSLTIAASPKSDCEGVYSFRILNADDLITSGVMEVADVHEKLTC